MKILHVEMGRYLYGGARQVAYLLEGLSRFPGEHALVCAESSEIASAIENPAVRVYPLAMWGDLDPGFITRLHRLIRQERPDLMHVHSRRGDFLSALAGRLENLPMIYSRRVDNPPSGFDRRLKFPLFKNIVTISEGIRDVLLQAGVPPDRVVCVPSAVDTERYRPERERDWFLREFKLQPGRPVLAVIAQLIPRKGHKMLFDALPAVLSRHEDLQVLIFGQGPLEAALRQAVRERGLQGCVRFEGFRTDLAQVIPCLDLIVHPAWMEGLGVSLLEAAACGVPIVATRTGGIPEVVRDGVNGYLIDAGDSQALAAAVIDLLACPEKARAYGQAGRRLVLERFAIDRMVEGNWQVYQSVAPKSSIQGIV